MGRKAAGPFLRTAGLPGILIRKELCMNKRSTITALCILSLLVFPRIGAAKMVALTDDQLCTVVGQAGVAVTVNNVGIDMTMNTLYWGDKDGMDGQTDGGYISFCDVALKGTIDFIKPLTIDTTTRMTELGTEISNIDIHLSDMTLDIDKFTVDSIRLGPNPGEGPSLGSFGIYGLHADITGDIRISAH
jgi:hypothetical protein